MSAPNFDAILEGAETSTPTLRRARVLLLRGIPLTALYFKCSNGQ